MEYIYHLTVKLNVFLNDSSDRQPDIYGAEIHLNIQVSN